MQDDTVKLLRECDAGVKMGISSIDDVLEHVTDEGLRKILLDSKQEHMKLEAETQEQLNAYSDEGKEPGAMAKMMSWVKTNMKLGGDNSDSQVANLITDGCNMGTKKLYEYLNDYPDAEDRAKKLVKNIIEAEEDLIKELRAYL